MRRDQSSEENKDEELNGRPKRSVTQKKKNNADFVDSWDNEFDVSDMETKKGGRSKRLKKNADNGGKESKFMILSSEEDSFHSSEEEVSFEDKKSKKK